MVVKKRKSIEGNTLHPVRWGRWVSKLPPPSIPSSFFCVQAGAAESAFSRALAQINCQRKSVSNMSVSCERRKRPFTQSTACEESPWSCCTPLSAFLLPAVALQPKGMEWTFLMTTASKSMYCIKEKYALYPVTGNVKSYSKIAIFGFLITLWWINREIKTQYINVPCLAVKGLMFFHGLESQLCSLEQII